MVVKVRTRSPLAAPATLQQGVNWFLAIAAKTSYGVASRERNMGKIAVVAMALCLGSTAANAAECPDGTMTLTGVRTVCVARDNNGRCTAVEQRQVVYCAPRK
jgi:hypothetical protein